MILVGKDDIIGRIDSEVNRFKIENACKLDYIILMEDEWVELLDYIGCPKSKQTQFYHKGIPLVKEGSPFDVKAYLQYLENEAKYE